MRPELTLFDQVAGAVDADTLPASSPLFFETQARASGFTSIAGIDEAGRGCLAGPVVAAAVILSENMFIDGVTDSKQLSPAKRSALEDEIKMAAVAFGIGVCGPAEIDEMNILQASLEAMRRAVLFLTEPVDYLLIDGNRAFDNPPCAVRTVIKGDRRSHSIAAASILAKTHRDRLMVRLHAETPDFGWDQNKGYPTPAHYDALKQNGPTRHHRKTFRLI